MTTSQPDPLVAELKTVLRYWPEALIVTGLALTAYGGSGFSGTGEFDVLREWEANGSFWFAYQDEEDRWILTAGIAAAAAGFLGRGKPRGRE